MTSFIPTPNIPMMPKMLPVATPKVFIPIWLYKYLTIMPFIGFFGIDHWALDSKFTGIAKLFVNLFTFGSWYAYDVVQAWNGLRSDSKTVQSEGLDIPFFEGFNIGKGKFDNQPLSNMSNNSQMWLLILFIGLFMFIYYITTFFLTSQSGFFLSSISTISFYGIFALLTYLIFFYFMSRTGSKSKFTPPKTAAAAKQDLYSSYGMANPLTTSKSTSKVSSVLGSVSKGLALPKMGGGGEGGGREGGGGREEGGYMEGGYMEGGYMEGGAGISDLVKTLQSMEPKALNKDHLYFISLLLILPISGFIAYALTKNKKKLEKDEIS